MSMDRQFKEDCKMVPRLKIQVSFQRKNISSTYLISITSLPEDEQRLSMGEEVGTMQFRVQGEQIKNDEIKNEYKEKKKDKEKVCIRKEIYIYICEFIKIK
jgi:hypothetical protein